MAQFSVEPTHLTARRHHAAVRGLIRAVAITWALLSLGAFAAVISLRPPTSPGELRIPVFVQGVDEETLAGVQFDIHYDPAQYTLVAVTPGGVATEAGKEVVFSETIPGQGRVLITGFNNTALTDGQVATLVLRPLNTSATHEDIGVTRFLATDPDGNSVPLDYEDIYGYAPPAPEEQEPEKEYPPEDDDTAETPEIDGSGDIPTPGAPAPSAESGSSTSSRSLGGYYPGGLSDGERAARTDDDARDSRPLADRTRSSQTNHAQRSGQSRQRLFSREHARVEHTGTQHNGDVQSSLSTPRAPAKNRPTSSHAAEASNVTHQEPSPTTPPGPRLALGGATVTPEALGSLARTTPLDDETIASPRSLKTIGLSLLAPLFVLAILGATHQLPRPRRHTHGWRKKR